MRKFYPPLLVLIFLLSAFSISAKETSWTIEFKKDKLSGQGLSTSTKSTTYISSGDKIVSSVSSATNCYYGESGGLRVGKSATGDSNLGNFKLNIAADYQVVPTKIVVKASASASGTSHSFTVSGFGTQTLTTGDETSYTINAATSDKLTTLSVSNAKTKKGMLYIASVTVYYDDGTGGGDTVQVPKFTITSDDAAVAGWYPNNATVAITAETGATIYYTTDGVTEPTDKSKSTKYESPLTFTKTTTVKAIAYLNGKNSDVSETTVKIGVPPASYETTYTFDFTKTDFGSTDLGSTDLGTVYGMPVTNSSNSYVKGESVVKQKGVTLKINSVNQGDNDYRLWYNKSNGVDLRLYSAKISISVESGVIKSVKFSKNSSNWGTVEETTSLGSLTNQTWVASETADANSVEFKFTPKVSGSSKTNTFLYSIDVTYDLGKPAPPCIVTETKTTIHVSCDENCTLEYKKVVYTPKANGPARANSIVDDAADWTPLDGNTVEIEKINNHGKQFTFRAKHASGAVSDETAFAVNADGTTTGVESVEAEEADAAPVEYFNLQGVRVMNPDKGLFIRRQGNRVEKVMMK